MNFFIKNDLEWSKLFGCTTDGAPAMQWRKSGFQTYVKSNSPQIIFSQNFIQRFALCGKVLTLELLLCLKQTVKIFSFVETSALNTQLFASFCADLAVLITNVCFFV